MFTRDRQVLTDKWKGALLRKSTLLQHGLLNHIVSKICN